MRPLDGIRVLDLTRFLAEERGRILLDNALGEGLNAAALLSKGVDARRRGISGDVVLEIVVRQDGSVGDVKILEGLGGGLNERAVDAVRRWRFAPAERQGVAVDVIVEVSVEFKLR